MTDIDTAASLSGLLELWGPALRRVASTRRRMEAAHYWRAEVAAYEAACAARDALGSRIEAACPR